MINKLKQSIAEASDTLKEQANQLSDSLREQANQLSDSVNQLGDSVKEQANNLTSAVKEKAYGLIEDWLEIFPKLESYGLKITSFGLKMGINPTLEVELQGNSNAFSPDKVAKMLEENQQNNALSTIFKAVKTALDWHAKTGSDRHYKSIFLKVSVSITPEVMVYLGEPKLM
ncbi:MAG: hypothetical protein MUE30_19690 [Spirosomaceae bacterium]|jgi:hypothetical protein|nr:hypothetical protein [Spirosomataceae bacterium]